MPSLFNFKPLFAMAVLLSGVSLLGGCASPPATPTPKPLTALPVSTALNTPLPTETAAITPSSTPSPSPTPDPRFGTLQEPVNDVQARPHPNDALAKAEEGMRIFTGGDVQTGDESRTALLLSPEETTVRIGANTHFVLQARSPEKETTVLQMLFGKLWVILKGGSLDVETPSGTASVRGSLMSVDYNPEQGSLTVTCLEGHCALQNLAGELVELQGGQMASIPYPDALPSEPSPIPHDELQEWLEMAPDEAQPFIDTLTPHEAPATPTAYHLVNNCDEVWHWRFTGPRAISIDIAPHSAASGLLTPAGTYSAIDWLGDNTSETHTTGPMPPGGTLTASVCQ